jgi:hypothetical protein
MHLKRTLATVGILSVSALAIAMTNERSMQFSDPVTYDPPSLDFESMYSVITQINSHDDSFADIARVVRIDHETYEYQLVAYSGLGNGQWSETSTTSFIVSPPADVYGGGVDTVFASDVNGDSLNDVVVLFSFYSENGQSYQYLTFLNMGGSGFRCAGDIDADGETRIHDLLDLLEDWGCTSEAQ